MSYATQDPELDHSFPDYQPKRFGLKYEPPTIILEYLVPSTGKLYHHRMRLRHLTAASDVMQQLEYLKKRHALYLNTTRLDDEQIMTLIGKLKASLNAADDEIDLNKLSPEEVLKHKQKMDIEFNKRSIKPGDLGFQYDLRKDFGPQVQTSGWDEDLGDEEYEDDYEDED
jgi:centrosomal protein CEP19